MQFSDNAEVTMDTGSDIYFLLSRPSSYQLDSTIISTLMDITLHFQITIQPMLFYDEEAK